MWWADTRSKYPDCSRSNCSSEVGTLSPDSFSCTLLHFSSEPPAVFTTYDFLPSLPLEPRSWFTVGTQTPLDLVLAFGVHEGTSHHTAVSGHLVDAVVAFGYIPWFEIAVIVHCKVVVCDNLFGLEAQLVRVGCCQWAWFDTMEVRDISLVQQHLISSTGSLLS